MQLRSILFLGTAVSLAATCFLGVALKNISEKKAHMRALAEEEWDAYTQAKELLEMGQPDEALRIAAAYDESPLLAVSDNWTELALKAYTLKGDKKSLAALFEWSREAFLQNEEAVLLAAEHYLESHEAEKYGQVRDFWRGFEERECAWLFLDADLLTMMGRQEEAHEILASQTFSGKDEVERLLRLNMLFADKDPKKAWGFLVDASKKDPRNPLVISSKAHLLEKMGNDEAAKGEYELSMKLSQNSFEAEEEYISFLMRQKEFGKAVPKLLSHLNAYSPKSEWYRALFLNKVTSNQEINLDTLPQDPYAKYLATLKSDELWNKGKFLELAQAEEILKTEPTAFWLRLLSAFKQENFKEAWVILHTAPKTLSENALAASLKYLLAFRGLGVAEVEEINSPLTTKDFTESTRFKTLLQHLARASLPGESPIETTDELDAFLASQEVVAALLLNEGWYEAAIMLYPFEHTTQEAPNWVIEKMITAINANRSSAKALEFAAYHHPKYDVMKQSLTLLNEAQDSERELDKVKLLLTQNSEAGLLTAKLAIDLYQKEENYGKVREVIEQQPKLHFTTQGKELLAQIALKQGDLPAADKIYQAIVKDSVEAKSFLAKKAFKEKDWRVAHQLTVELLKEYPNNPTLLQNLSAIAAYK